MLSLCSVDYCDPSYCNGSSCDKCFDGYFRHVIEDFCYKCYLYCKQCNGYDSQCYNCFHPGCSSDVCDLANCTTAGCSGNTNVPCSSCPDGFYLSNHRCYRCNKVNCKCSSASNCIGCLLGYYGTSNACIGKCPSNCISCKNSINCDECISGKYGQTCETECINTCQDGICDKESGTCLAGCASNEYFHSGGICRPCPSRCNSCSNVTFCTDCKTYFMWGSICQYECTGCYSMCTMKDGCSLGCYSNYYLSYNVKKNGYECTHCPADCQTCTNMTLCQTCVQGRWGNICQYNCTGCSRECDALKGCVSGCLPGYYREASETGSVCLSCSKECETCTNATICQTCKCETDISDVCNGKSGKCRVNPNLACHKQTIHI